MIEPEIAFCDLEQDMNIMEEMLKYVVKYTLDNAKDEMVYLDKYVEKGLIDKTWDKNKSYNPMYDEIPTGTSYFTMTPYEFEYKNLRNNLK